MLQRYKNYIEEIGKHSAPFDLLYHGKKFFPDIKANEDEIILRDLSVISLKQYIEEGIKASPSPVYGTNAPSFNNHQQGNTTFIGLPFLSTVALFNSGDRALVVDEFVSDMPEFSIRTSNTGFSSDSTFETITRNGRISRSQFNKKDVSKLETLGTFSTGISVILDLADRKHYKKIKFSAYSGTEGLDSLYDRMVSNHVFLKSIKALKWSITKDKDYYVLTKEL